MNISTFKTIEILFFFQKITTRQSTTNAFQPISVPVAVNACLPGWCKTNT